MRKPKKLKSVPDRLADLGKIYKERNKSYGNNYFHFGDALYAMFGGPLTLETPEEFNRFALFIHALGKLSRYSQMLAMKGHHPDSLDDLSVYSQMLREYDEYWDRQRIGNAITRKRKISRPKKTRSRKKNRV